MTTPVFSSFGVHARCAGLSVSEFLLWMTRPVGSHRNLTQRTTVWWAEQVKRGDGWATSVQEPCQVLGLSDKSWNLRLKNPNSASTAWIHGPDLPGVNSLGCWWCSDGWGNVSLTRVGPLTPTNHGLNAAAWLGIVADHMIVSAKVCPCSSRADDLPPAARSEVTTALTLIQ